MPRPSKIHPEQIDAARKMLRELPVKEGHKTSSEAALLLSKDFRAAFKKGYSAKDISELLKQGGIPISASVVKEYNSSDRSY